MHQTQPSLKISEITPEHFADIIKLGNEVHGDNYLTDESLQEIYQKGFNHDINLSYVAHMEDKLIGFRLTYAPNKWKIDKWCTPTQWGVDSDKVVYFKCNTVDEAYRGHGIGGKLLTASIEKAKSVGAVAGVAHLWRQSPGNSSVKYFTKAGGILVKDHPDRWNKAHYGDNYICTICGEDCHCVAAEMILHF
ncbi:GNAT family N-acetyltransferase [Flocculibacter collagenilyticus]|uniref:GNAT family N-acetyltransferase n=1 Tax=Flocculibacter collagenilyticus TaxID=2744479 RepID=UPI0018F729CF|nr:GNAT family N-acetyltransferase [Flocculibacter collagenilyticus]